MQAPDVWWAGIHPGRRRFASLLAVWTDVTVRVRVRRSRMPSARDHRHVFLPDPTSRISTAYRRLPEPDELRPPGPTRLHVLPHQSRPDMHDAVRVRIHDRRGDRRVSAPRR